MDKMKKLLLLLLIVSVGWGAVKYTDRYANYPTAPKQVLSNGTESGWTAYAGGTISFDSTHFITSPRALKLTNTASNIVYAQLNVTRKTISTDGAFIVKVYLTDTTATNFYLSLYKNTTGNDFYSVNGSSSIWYKNQGPRTGFFIKGWNTWHLDKTWFTANGSPSWDTIQRLRIGIQSSGSTVSNTIVSEVSFVPKQLAKGTFTFRIDDGYTSQVNVLLPKFRQYGWKATFFPIISWINGSGAAGKMTWSGLDSLYRLGGFDIGLHSLNENNSDLTTLTPSQIANEYFAGGDSIVAHGIPRPKLTGFPGNKTNEVIDSISKIYFDFGCIGNYSTMQPVPFQNTTRIQTGLNLTGTTTFTGIKPSIDSVITYKGYSQLLIHGVGDVAHLSTSVFDSLCTYLKAKQDSGLCDIKSMGELLLTVGGGSGISRWAAYKPAFKKAYTGAYR